MGKQRVVSTVPRPTGRAERRGGLTQLANELGYRPGEFTIRRMVEAAKALKEWSEYLDQYGKAPPELGSMSPGEARGFLAREIADLVKMETGLLDFFYPKQRATTGEMDHNLKGEITVKVVRFGVTDGGGS